jgi:hypothetical protein
MKPILNYPVATETPGASAAWKRLSPKVSFQTASRQGSTASKIGTGVRVPASPLNRAYLKALRQAEMAAWERANRRPERPVSMRPTFVRLPAPARDARENWLYAVLAVLAVATVGSQLWTTLQLAGNWHNFVQFVRQLIA